MWVTITFIRKTNLATSNLSAAVALTGVPGFVAPDAACDGVVLAIIAATINTMLAKRDLL